MWNMRLTLLITDKARKVITRDMKPGTRFTMISPSVLHVFVTQMPYSAQKNVKNDVIMLNQIQTSEVHQLGADS